MSGFYGANTDQLRDHAQLMVQKAQRVVELRDSLAPLVLDESSWTGPDADAFRQTWNGRVATLFGEGEQLITRRGTDLDGHAEEQDTASGVGGVGGSEGSAEGDAFNPFGFVGELLVKGQSAYKGFQSMMKFADAIPSAFSEFAKLKNAGLEKLWKAGYLDDLFKGGKGWQSAAEKVLGKVGIPNSIGDFRPLSMLNKLDDVAPWLKTAGSWMGKALPAFDVISGGVQAFNGFKEGDIYDGVSGSLNSLGGALLIAAPFTGPAAPILGAVGAGLGIVSAGMDLGRMVYDNWDNITSTVSDVGSAVADGVSNVGSAVADGVSNVGSAVADGVSDVASTAGEAIGNAVDTAGDVVDNVGSAVSDAIGGFGEALGF